MSVHPSVVCEHSHAHSKTFFFFHKYYCFYVKNILNIKLLTAFRSQVRSRETGHVHGATSALVSKRERKKPNEPPNFLAAGNPSEGASGGAARPQPAPPTPLPDPRRVPGPPGGDAAATSGPTACGPRAGGEEQRQRRRPLCPSRPPVPPRPLLTGAGDKQQQQQQRYRLQRAGSTGEEPHGRGEAAGLGAHARRCCPGRRGGAGRGRVLHGGGRCRSRLRAQP